MAKIRDFGTVNEQKENGYKGIGVVEGTESEVLNQFFSDSVILVKGARVHNTDKFEFYVMVKRGTASERI